jgi:hypothetical protein
MVKIARGNSQLSNSVEGRRFYQERGMRGYNKVVTNRNELFIDALIKKAPAGAFY